MLKTFEKVITLIKSVGPMKFSVLVFKKLFNISNYKQIADYFVIEKFFQGMEGLEIGGPSSIFSDRGLMPIYSSMKTLDGVNFAASTVWTGEIVEDKGFLVEGRRVGRQFIFDAVDCRPIAGSRYDFVLSSNNIEHLANPLKAIEQWLSVLKPGGVLVLIAPRKESNFDHRREIVSFDHLLCDYQNDTDEGDLTHLEEILERHDLKLDRPAGSFQQFKERSLNNSTYRCLHHHVFDLGVLKDICRHFSLVVIKEIQIESDYVIIGKK